MPKIFALLNFCKIWGNKSKYAHHDITPFTLLVKINVKIKEINQYKTRLIGRNWNF